MTAIHIAATYRHHVIQSRAGLLTLLGLVLRSHDDQVVDGTYGKKIGIYLASGGEGPTGAAARRVPTRCAAYWARTGFESRGLYSSRTCIMRTTRGDARR